MHLELSLNLRGRAESRVFATNSERDSGHATFPRLRHRARSGPARLLCQSRSWRPLKKPFSRFRRVVVVRRCLKQAQDDAYFCFLHAQFSGELIRAAFVRLGVSSKRANPNHMSIFPFVWAGLVCSAAVGFEEGLPILRKRRKQVRFIHDTLAVAPIFNRQRVIASLSTLPDRINHLRPTLQSLLTQTRPPDEIVVAIPEFCIREQKAYAIPDYLPRLPRVRILRCEKDWGPATKFIPTIQDELKADRADTLVMVVDDDRAYPRDALETYIYYHEQLREGVLCFRGAAMPRTFDWRDAKMIFGNRLRAPQQVAVITGCGSYLIQPRFFDDSLWDYSTAPEGAFYMDDIWISGYLSRRGIDRHVIPATNMMRTVLRQRWTVSLHDVPNGRQFNNNETIKFFQDSWNVFA